MKANPGKANYGTSGAGTVPHFAGLLLGQAAGVTLTCRTAVDSTLIREPSIMCWIRSGFSRD